MDAPENHTSGKAVAKLSGGTLTLGAVAALMVGQWMFMGIAADLLSSAVIFGIGYGYGRFFK